MIAPETLLRMHPVDALRAQIGEVLKPPLKASYLKIEKPKAVSGTLTSVVISIDKSKTPVELWGMSDSFTFQYNRIRLDTFTAGISRRVKTGVPIHADDVLRALLAPYQIPVDKNDVVAAEFTALGDVSLIASEESYRWLGEIPCLLDVLGIDITTCIIADRFTIPFDISFFSNNVKGRLVTFINLNNPSSLPQELTAAMFALGSPVANGPIAAGDNTKLTLNFLGVPYTGTLDVYYQRRGFDHTFRFPVKLQGAQLNNTAQLATALSAQMGCTITAADILSEPFPQMDKGTTTKLAVNFDPASLAYVGTVLVKYSRTT